MDEVIDQCFCQCLCLMANTDSSIVAAIVGVVGTLSGVAVATFATTRANKERRTMDLFTTYLNEVYPKEGVAIGVLDAQPDCTLTDDQIDDTRYVGNWFDIYAALAIKRALSKSLCKRVKLEERVKNFWCKYQHSHVKRQIDGQNCQEEWLNMQKLGR